MMQIDVSKENGFQNTKIGLIPSDWELCPLEDIAKTTSGGTPSRKHPEYYDGSIAWVKSGELVDKGIHVTEETISLEGLKNSSAKLFPKGTLLIAMYGATVGKTGILEIDATTNQAICAVLPVKELDSRFLMYQFIARRDELLKQRYGGAQPNISQQIIRSFQIKLPPLSEQHRIATVLNALQNNILAQEDIIAQACEFKRSLMQHLFTHGVTPDPVETKLTDIGEIPVHWDVVEFKQVREFLQYGTSQRCDYGIEGSPVLRIPNVIGGKIDLRDLKYTVLSKEVVKLLKLYIGDILFVRTNGRKEYTGRSAVYEDGLEDALFASYLIRARPKHDIASAHFLQYYTMTDIGMSFLSGRAIETADGKFNINTGTIDTMLVPLPPTLEEQYEIAAQLAIADSKIAAEEDRKTALQDLFKTMLHQLMTGQIRLLD